MSSFNEILTPSGQNPTQRRGYFSSIAIACFVLLLHFPFEGYDIDHLVSTRSTFSPCPTVSAATLKEMTSEQLDDIAKCLSAVETQFLPLSEWRSKAPLIDWFGSVVHSTIAFVFALALGIIWLWVFRTRDDG